MTTKEEIDAIVVRLESQNIYLSEYGNHAGRGAILKRDKYEMSKNMDALFADVKVIDRIRCNIRGALVKDTKWVNSSSYGLKHYIEEWRKTNNHDAVRGDYLSNGDFILAMILEGYEYKFRDRVNSKIDSPSDVNCDFKCRAW